MTGGNRIRFALAPVALGLALGACGLFSPVEETNPPYTEEEILENVVTYLGVVFGPDTPTVTDYFAAEGPAPGLERELELAECSRQSGSPIASLKISPSQECLDFISERRKNSDVEASLYYQALRERVRLVPERMRIEGIADPEPGGEFYRIIARDASTGRWVQIYHAATKGQASVSRLGLQRVDGESIADLLGPRLEGWGR